MLLKTAGVIVKEAKHPQLSANETNTFHLRQYFLFLSDSLQKSKNLSKNFKVVFDFCIYLFCIVTNNVPLACLLFLFIFFCLFNRSKEISPKLL